MTNLSLQKKTAARIAAVQCLYQAAVTKEELSPEEAVKTLKNQLADNREEQKLKLGSHVEPHYTLLETLLTGVLKHRDEIDLRLGGALKAEWTAKRMSPLLVAILECAIFELFFHKDVKSRILTDEYTRLTRSFFEGPEVNFVHGALATLTAQYHG